MAADTLAEECFSSVVLEKAARVITGFEGNDEEPKMMADMPLVAVGEVPMHRRKRRVDEASIIISCFV